jgi:hypothetical protein
VGKPVIAYEPTREPREPTRAYILLLLLITLFGGILRFWKLSDPPLWGDEAATYSRVCGTYQELIDILQFNGFVPLHYELYHWIASGMPTRAHIEHRAVEPVQPRGRSFFQRLTAKPATQPTTKPFLVGDRPLVPGGVRMTPIVMRFIPALAGTLMIPAMYFLAVQIVNRRAALVCALFTACSAYMLVYSRDAKMYMHFWLCCALSVACLLWWLRVRTRIAWLCWVASSVAMCGLHAPGVAILAVELLILLSYTREWRVAGCILLAGLLAAGMVTGQTSFFRARFDARYVVIGAALLLAIVAFLMQRRRDWVPPVFFIVGLAVILSGIGTYYLKFNRYKEQIEEKSWIQSGIFWVDEYNQARTGPDLLRFTTTAYLMSWEWTQPEEEKFVDARALKLLHGAVYAMGALLVVGLIRWKRRSATEVAQPPGRPLLWILGWIVVPAYVSYCVSMGSGSKLVKGVWTPGFASPNWWLVELSDWVRDARIWALGVACVIAICFYISGRTFRERFAKTGSILAALAVVYTLCGGIYLITSDLNRRAMLNGGHWHSLWMPRYLGMIWPAFAIAVATLLWRLPTRPLRYGAISLVALINLAQFSARLHQSEPPTETIARDLLKSGDAKTYLLGNFANGYGVKPGEGLFQSVAWH